MTPNSSEIHPRRIGAVAGLAPALLALVIVVVLGGSPSLAAFAWLGVMTVIAVAIGSLLGPLSIGSFRSDLPAMAAYTLVGSLAYVLVGTVASIRADPAFGGPLDLGALATRLAGQIAYGLLYLPFWAVGLAPFALAWIVAVRVLRRRAGIAPPSEPSLSAGSTASGRHDEIRRRRLALIAAGIILVYALVVVAVPFVLYDDPRPPWWLDRPIALFVLFAVPAVIGAAGALYGVRPLLVAAGVLTLCQAYVAFSGVTLGFVLPAAVLIWAGGAGSTSETRTWRGASIGGIAVIALTVTAWVSLLALTEPRCWAGERMVDGTIRLVEVAATDAELHGPADVPAWGGGCGSAELTPRGMAVSAVFAIGALAVSAVATVGARKVSAA
jgi:hypothetical protein